MNYTQELVRRMTTEALEFAAENEFYSFSSMKDAWKKAHPHESMYLPTHL